MRKALQSPESPEKRLHLDRYIGAGVVVGTGGGGALEMEHGNGVE